MSNKCPHNKEEFQCYTRPLSYKKPPTQILNLITSFYKAFWNKLSELNRAFNDILLSKRFRRSERREVYQGVMQFLLNHYDLLSGKISRFTLKDMAHWCQFSIDRVEAAMMDLEAAGFITKKVVYVIKGRNDIRTSATEITLCNHFFNIIGYGHAKLEEARAYRRKKEYSSVINQIVKRTKKMLKIERKEEEEQNKPKFKTIFDKTFNKNADLVEKKKNDELIRLRQNASNKMLELKITTMTPNWKELVGWPG